MKTRVENELREINAPYKPEVENVVVDYNHQDYSVNLTKLNTGVTEVNGFRRNQEDLALVTDTIIDVSNLTNSQIDDALNLTGDALQDICKDASEKGDIGGSCSITNLIIPDKNNAKGKDNKFTIHTKTTGDSVSYFGVIDESTGSVDEFTLLNDPNKAKPTDPAEEKRIESNGGFIIRGRLNGTLAVSRSYGDFKYYNAGMLAESHKSQDIQPNPDKRTFQVPKGKLGFVITACDGLTENSTIIKIKDTIELLFKKCKANNTTVTPQMICEALVTMSLKDESKDNISVIVTILDASLKEPIFVGVFDGHGGNRTAMILEKNYVPVLNNQLGKQLENVSKQQVNALPENKIVIKITNTTNTANTANLESSLQQGKIKIKIKNTKDILPVSDQNVDAPSDQPLQILNMALKKILPDSKDLSFILDKNSNPAVYSFTFKDPLSLTDNENIQKINVILRLAMASLPPGKNPIINYHDDKKVVKMDMSLTNELLQNHNKANYFLSKVDELANKNPDQYLAQGVNAENEWKKNPTNELKQELCQRYLLASLSGSAKGAEYLGFFLIQDGNPQEAFDYIVKAAYGSRSLSQFNLARMYATGNTPSGTNLKCAREWLTLAEKNSKQQNEIFTPGAVEGLRNEIKKIEEEFANLVKLADGGNYRFQFNLAMRYVKGNTPSGTDLESAQKWLTLAEHNPDRDIKIVTPENIEGLRNEIKKVEEEKLKDLKKVLQNIFSGITPTPEDIKKLSTGSEYEHWLKWLCRQYEIFKHNPADNELYYDAVDRLNRFKDVIIFKEAPIIQDIKDILAKEQGKMQKLHQPYIDILESYLGRLEKYLDMIYDSKKNNFLEIGKQRLILLDVIINLEKIPGLFGSNIKDVQTRVLDKSEGYFNTDSGSNTSDLVGLLGALSSRIGILPGNPNANDRILAKAAKFRCVNLLNKLDLVLDNFNNANNSSVNRDTINNNITNLRDARLFLFPFDNLTFDNLSDKKPADIVELCNLVLNQLLVSKNNEEVKKNYNELLDKINKLKNVEPLKSDTKMIEVLDKVVKTISNGLSKNPPNIENYNKKRFTEEDLAIIKANEIFMAETKQLNDAFKKYSDDLANVLLNLFKLKLDPQKSQSETETTIMLLGTFAESSTKLINILNNDLKYYKSNRIDAILHDIEAELAYVPTNLFNEKRYQKIINATDDLKNVFSHFGIMFSSIDDAFDELKPIMKKLGKQKQKLLDNPPADLVKLNEDICKLFVDYLKTKPSVKPESTEINPSRENSKLIRQNLQTFKPPSWNGDPELTKKSYDDAHSMAYDFFGYDETTTKPRAYKTADDIMERITLISGDKNMMPVLNNAGILLTSFMESQVRFIR